MIAMRPEFTTLPLYEIMSRLAVATVLGLIAAGFNSYLARDTASSRFFFPAQVLIAVIVATMMIAIDERLPRALGLFASLSIVRFRMPIKSLREMVFIFLAVCVGVSAGSGAFLVAALGTGTGLLTLLFISVFRENRFFGSERRMLEIVLNKMDSGAAPGTISQLEKVLADGCDRYSESETRNLSGLSTKLYEVWLDRALSDDEFLQSIQSKVPGIQSIRLIRLFNADESVF